MFKSIRIFGTSLSTKKNNLSPIGSKYVPRDTDVVVEDYVFGELLCVDESLVRVYGLPASRISQRLYVRRVVHGR